jgi:hypothetical protein
VQVGVLVGPFADPSQLRGGDRDLPQSPAATASITLASAVAPIRDAAIQQTSAITYGVTGS